MKKVFRMWKLRGLKWYEFLYMWLTPTTMWKDEIGVHYEKKVGKVIYRQDIML